MLASLYDTRRFRRGVPTATLLLLIVLGVYTFIACIPATENSASTDSGSLPVNDPESPEPVGLDLNTENGERQDVEVDLDEQRVQGVPCGAAQPTYDGIPPNRTVAGWQDSLPEPTPTILALSCDGIQYRLLSPHCHEDPNPECGPTKMYVGETLVLAVRAEKQGYSLHFNQDRDEESELAPICGRPSGQMDDRLQEYHQKVSQRGSDFEFEALSTCGTGRVTVLMDRADGKTGQHHTEVFPLPAEVERHPYIPTPLPTLSPEQVARAEEQAEQERVLQERFNRVTAKLDDGTFQTALQGVALTCPAYANSKSFEINEKLTEMHRSAGLSHLMEARKQGVKTPEIWAMIEDGPEQVEEYVAILEWAYGEYTDMIKKPGSLFGCN